MIRENNTPAPEAKCLDERDVVSRRNELDTRERHDYEAKQKEIREIIMDLETRYKLEKIFKEDDFVFLDIEGKIKFLENKLNELRKERIEFLKNNDIKFQYMDLRSWYDERVNFLIGQLHGSIITWEFFE